MGISTSSRRIASQWVEENPSAQLSRVERHILRRVARRYLLEDMRLAREFSTKEEYKKYLKEHPNADPSRHTVKETKPSGGGAESRVKARLTAFVNKVKGVSSAIKGALEKAPEATQRMVADPEYRKEVLSSAGSALKKAPGYIGKRVWQAAKDEAKATFVDSPRIVATAIKDRKMPSKKDLKTLYGTAVYAGGAALAAIPALPALAGAAGTAATVAAIGGVVGAAGSAFAHSFSLHVSIKAFSYMFQGDEKFNVSPEVADEYLEDAERVSKADEGFLAYEALETVAGAGSAAETVVGGAEIFTLMAQALPSSGALYKFSPWSLVEGAVDFGKMLVTSADKDSKDDDKVMEEFFNTMTKNVGRVLEEGLTDEDMAAILREDAVKTSSSHLSVRNMDRKTKQLALEYAKLEQEAKKINQKNWGGYAERDALNMEARRVNKRMNDIIRLTGAKNLTEMDILVWRAKGMKHRRDNGQQIGKAAAARIAKRYLAATGQIRMGRLLHDEDVQGIARTLAANLRDGMSLRAKAASQKEDAFRIHILHASAPRNLRQATADLKRIITENMPQGIVGARVAAKHMGAGAWAVEVTLPGALRVALDHEGMDADDLEAGRKWNKGQVYGPPYSQVEYDKKEPTNRGTPNCYYMSGDPSKRCYVKRDSPKGLSKNKKQYNKWWRENVLKKRAEAERRQG